eukprot:TRINITY_DN708_c0_g1_i1.p1 TRINITY_DN708_c0_g1~~TRINITY_DN708_c0_g1_i1.p1  ORF type:complete len:543 (-),score=126.90 TRINITY_DN708_c0_g1_i1:1641-3242(-)
MEGVIGEPMFIHHHNNTDSNLVPSSLPPQHQSTTTSAPPTTTSSSTSSSSSATTSASTNSSPPNLSMGATVKIRAAQHLHQKLHDYAGTYAEIIEIPVHPNTWFTVKTADNKKIKMRASAFEFGYAAINGTTNHSLVNVSRMMVMNNAANVRSAKVRSRAPPTQLEGAARSVMTPIHITSENQRFEEDANEPPVYEMEFDSAPIEQHQQLSTVEIQEAAPTESAEGAEVAGAEEGAGMKVKIVCSSDVMVKFPNLAGLEGHVIETPVHPNTWYTVKLNNGRVVKLRRNSLRFEFDGTGDSDVLRNRKTLSDEEEAYFQSWVGTSVVVRKGKDSGVQGVVTEFIEGGFFRIKTGQEVDLVKKVCQVEHARKRKESFEELAAKRARRASAKELSGSYVNILAGKFSGKVGYVTRGGNGYCVVEVWDRETQPDSPFVVMKRCADLRLLGEDSNSMDVDSTCPSQGSLFSISDEKSPSCPSPSTSASSETIEKNEDHPEIVGAASVLMHLLVASPTASLSSQNTMQGELRTEGSMFF